MKKELLANISMKAGNSPIALTASTNGTVIDRLGYGSAYFAVATGASGGSEAPESFSLTAKIQDGAESDGSDMADYNPDGSDIVTTAVTTENSESAKKFADLSAAQRYIRLVLDPDLTGGSSPSLVVSSYVVLGDPHTDDNWT